jgi:hypothetical protein
MPSAAKAGYGGVIHGTAEAVPFLNDRVLTQGLKSVRESSNNRHQELEIRDGQEGQRLKPDIFSIVYGPTKVVP